MLTKLNKLLLGKQQTAPLSFSLPMRNLSSAFRHSLPGAYILDPASRHSYAWGAPGTLNLLALSKIEINIGKHILIVNHVNPGHDSPLSKIVILGKFMPSLLSCVIPFCCVMPKLCVNQMIILRRGKKQNYTIWQVSCCKRCDLV